MCLWSLFLSQFLKLTPVVLSPKSLLFFVLSKNSTKRLSSVPQQIFVNHIYLIENFDTAIHSLLKFQYSNILIFPQANKNFLLCSHICVKICWTPSNWEGRAQLLMKPWQTSASGPDVTAIVRQKSCKSFETTWHRISRKVFLKIFWI